MVTLVTYAVFSIFVPVDRPELSFTLIVAVADLPSASLAIVHELVPLL